MAGVKRQGVNNDRASKVLKVSDLLGTHGLTKNVPHKSLKEIVFRKLSMCDRMVAIDVETHDLVPRGLSAWSVDQFGLRTRVAPEALSSLRIVEVGCAAGTISEISGAKGVLVRPDGFAITSKATDKHGITQQMADTSGVPLQEALRTMIRDVLEHCDQGACLVSHNLPFDAGLVYEELSRAGLDHLKEEWARAARNGIDTMDPDIAHWAWCKAGYEGKDWLAPKSLADLVYGFVPCASSLLKEHHRAGADASMHLALCRELVKCYRSERE